MYPVTMVRGAPFNHYGEGDWGFLIGKNIISFNICRTLYFFTLCLKQNIHFVCGDEYVFPFRPKQRKDGVSPGGKLSISTRHSLLVSSTTLGPHFLGFFSVYRVGFEARPGIAPNCLRVIK